MADDRMRVAGAQGDNFPRAAWIIEIDPAELAVRMMEAGSQVTRPVADAREALATMSQEDQDMLLRAAEAAALYLRECLKASAVQ